MTKRMIYRVINMCEYPVVKQHLNDIFRLMYKATRRKIAKQWQKDGYGARGGSYDIIEDKNMDGFGYGYAIIVHGPDDLLLEIKKEFDKELHDLQTKESPFMNKIRGLIHKVKRSQPITGPGFVGKAYEFWSKKLGWHMSAEIEDDENGRQKD